MDFVESVMKKFGYVKEKKTEDEKTQVVTKPKSEISVCIPMHARKKEKDSKKIKFVIKEEEEESPFDKLRKEYEKDRTEFNKEVKQIIEQQPSEPFDYEPELGIESIEKPVNPVSLKSVFAKYRKEDDSIKGESKGDELDLAGKKMIEGYVPKFSKTARQKMGLEEKSANDSSSTGYAQFEVTGVYSGAETMISGIVRCGKLTKRMSAQIGKSTIRVSDLKQSLCAVNEINEGEEGTIFTRGSVGLIRNGDVIEFA